MVINDSAFGRAFLKEREKYFFYFLKKIVLVLFIYILKKIKIENKNIKSYFSKKENDQEF